MKTLILTCLLLTLSVCCFAQQVAAPDPINLRMNKAGKQLQSASTFIISGVVVGALGAVLAAQKTDSKGHTNQTPGLIAVGAGGLLVFVGYVKIGIAGRALQEGK